MHSIYVYTDIYLGLKFFANSCIYVFVFFPLVAVYLCKRTMQNKSRLELDDYEAVSPTGWNIIYVDVDLMVFALQSSFHLSTF